MRSFVDISAFVSLSRLPWNKKKLFFFAEPRHNSEHILFAPNVIQGQTNYVSSKSGLVGFTKSLAMEVATRGITVNCVAPGMIDSDMIDSLNEKQKETIERVQRKKPGEVTKVCVKRGENGRTKYVTIIDRTKSRTCCHPKTGSEDERQTKEKKKKRNR